MRTVHLDFMDPPAAQVTSAQTGLSKTSPDKLVSPAVLVSLSQSAPVSMVFVILD